MYQPLIQVSDDCSWCGGIVQQIALLTKKKTSSGKIFKPDFQMTKIRQNILCSKGLIKFGIFVHLEMD